MARALLNPRSWGNREEDPSKRLVTLLEPTGTTSEAYRTLRTSLLYSFVDNPPRVIVLTSPGPGEGKSTTCANLGVVLAQADKRTLIIDGDLRKPVMHRIFGLRNIRGVVNVLAGEHDLHEVWQEPLVGLKVITSGALPPNPAELVGSRRFAELVERARKMFDFVLIDAPPVELVSDPAIVAAQGDGVLLVLDAQNTRKASVRRSMRGLRKVGGNVLGTVMNNARSTGADYYHQQGYVSR